MKVQIPSGIEPKHLAEVRCIMERLRDKLQKFEAKQINLRLHKSATSDPIPYFIDWVGVQDVLKILKRDERELDPGLLRFGDDTPSQVNKEAVTGGLKSMRIVDRDWTTGMEEKRPGSKLLAQKANVMFQKVIGIIAFDDDSKTKRCVGTFTAGFEKAPENHDQINKELMRIAGWTGQPSELVEWIHDNVVPGGPPK